MTHITTRKDLQRKISAVNSANKTLWHYVCTLDPDDVRIQEARKEYERAHDEMLVCEHAYYKQDLME